MIPLKTAHETKQIFEELPVPAALRTMVVPTIISQIIVLIYNMADTFYVGRTNNPYMVAGVSLILPVFNITLCLAGIAGVGGGTLISRLLGENRESEAKKAGCFSIYLSILVALLFSVLTAVFMAPILKLLGAGENTFLYARQYTFCVIVIGGIPTVLSNVLSNLIRSAGFSKEAGIGITMGGILNMVLDPLFMFVLLPKGNEVLGVGIATCLSNCIACLYFFFVLFRTRKESIITCSPKVGFPERKSITAIFFVGIPAALTTLLFDLDYIVIDKLMVSYSDIALAAIGIVLKVERLPLNVGIGICQGMVPLVAYNYAANHYERMDAIMKRAKNQGLIVAIISILAYEIFAVSIIQFFIADTQTVTLAIQFLRIRVLATPLMFFSFFTTYLFQAFGCGNKALFLGVMRWMVFNIPMLFLLNHLLGMFGIVWAQLTACLLYTSRCV